MARRRHGGGSRGFMGKGGTLVKQAALGMAGAMVVGAVANKFVPQYAGVASMAGAYLGGGFVGLAAQFLISGMPSLGSAATTTTNW